MFGFIDSTWPNQFIGTALISSVVCITGEGNEKVQRFKRWFWAVVEKMNNHERQDLVSLSFI